MVEVILTSFKKSLAFEARLPKYSAAVYQPRGFTYPKLDFFDIRRPDGEWIRPRLFVTGDIPALDGYRDALLSLYAPRRGAILSWLDQLSSTAILCCWCPYDRAAQRQLVQFGSFVCHTEVMRLVLEGLGATVHLDIDRQKRMKRLG